MEGGGGSAGNAGTNQRSSTCELRVINTRRGLGDLTSRINEDRIVLRVFSTGRSVESAEERYVNSGSLELWPDPG